MNAATAEYIWIDGSKPTRTLRSKTRLIPKPEITEIGSFPEWGFDGSSTNQADGNASDCKLKPVCVVPDPTRGNYPGGSFLVLCEVYDPATNEPHKTNTRAALRRLTKQVGDQKPWVGIEQEYTMFKGAAPLGFDGKRRFPAEQGPYYCGVGADEVDGRDLVEQHMFACVQAGLAFCGINAEVMPGQWEFQIGGPKQGPLVVSDHLWLARWLLYRLGERQGIHVTLDAKPVSGDWNGAGAHTNFSTEAMRAEGGLDAIIDACNKLGERVRPHLAVYGDGVESRLTGKHETCRHDEFRFGVGDRTASIRIPAHVGVEKKGYLEDRRPCANADPYEVIRVLLETCCT